MSSPSSVETLDEGRLAVAVAGVVSELRRKAPGYLRLNPLRVSLPAGTSMPAAGTAATELAEACRQLGAALGVRIELMRSEIQPSGAVDRYLSAMLAGVSDAAGEPVRPATAAEVAAGWIEAEAAARRQALRLPETLPIRRCGLEGTQLQYLATGTGEPIVFVNALGQGLIHWMPLMHLLRDRYRVIAWKLLGDLPTGAATLTDQVRALAAIVADSGAGPVHLIGWCAGAKISLEFARQHPEAVRSVMLLNGAFKRPGRLAELDTPYERALATVCSAVDRRPERAGSLRSLFVAGLRAGSSDASLAEQDGDPLAEVDPQLHAAMLEPFADDARLRTYARQHLDYWARGLGNEGLPPSLPLLLLASEQDRIISAAGVRDAAAYLPGARLLNLPGAGHHRMFDRPDLIAAVVERFLSDPGSVGI
jgi:pimeloyl-ACP methyl ester carboxylesterase